MMSTILDCSRCGKEYKYSEIDEHECADVVVLRARIALPDTGYLQSGEEVESD